MKEPDMHGMCCTVYFISPCVCHQYRAVVFIAHGVGEHSGRYEHNGLGTFLKNSRYAVHSHDHG